MTDDNRPVNPVVIQPRCPYCLVEHYVLNTIAISYGEITCPRCGEGRVFTTEEDYRNAIRRARQREPQG